MAPVLATAAANFSDDEKAAIKWYEGQTERTFMERHNGGLVFLDQQGRRRTIHLVDLMWQYRIDQRSRGTK